MLSCSFVALPGCIKGATLACTCLVVIVLPGKLPQEVVKLTFAHMQRYNQTDHIYVNRLCRHYRNSRVKLFHFVTCSLAWCSAAITTTRHNLCVLTTDSYLAKSWL